MSDTINIENEIPEGKLSIVPVLIDFNGEAKANQYFTPTRNSLLSSSDEKIETAYFRGLKLVGKKLELGPDYKGYVLSKSENISGSTQEDLQLAKLFTSIAKFDEITVFGHDTYPDENDQWITMNEWKEISDVINS